MTAPRFPESRRR